MQKEKVKITYQNFLFELNFKTENCFQMTVTDIFENRKYGNSNVQFNKIQKASIITALQEKKRKDITCKISEQMVEKLEQQEEARPILKDKCLRVQFIVSLQFIQPFSQSVILYQIKGHHKSSNVTLKKLSKEDSISFKRQIQEIQAAIPTGNQSPQQTFQLHQVGNTTLAYDKPNQQKFIIMFTAYGIFLLVLWITYLKFLEFLLLTLISIAIMFMYFRSQRYLIKSIELKNGTYKIHVTGLICVQRYTQTGHGSFLLHAQFNQWSSEKLKICINSTNNYAYPFNGTFLISSRKDQTLNIKLQKNTKIYPVTLQNVVITVDKISHFA